MIGILILGIIIVVLFSVVIYDCTHNDGMFVYKNHNWVWNGFKKEKDVINPPQEGRSQMMSKELKQCKHRYLNHHYEYVQCVDCLSIKTDSDNSWGIAKNKWFKSLEEANFYRQYGRLPEQPKNLSDYYIIPKEGMNIKLFKTICESRESEYCPKNKDSLDGCRECENITKAILSYIEGQDKQGVKG